MTTLPLKVVPFVKSAEADRVRVAKVALPTPGCTTVSVPLSHVNVK